MSKARKPVEDDLSPIWTKERQARAVPFAERFPHLVKAAEETAARRTRGPQKAPTKELISIRLSPEVVAGLRSHGRGWQGVANEILRKGLKIGSAEKGLIPPAASQRKSARK